MKESRLHFENVFFYVYIHKYCNKKMKKSITNFIVDKFYGGKVLKAVVNSTLSNETINTIKDFMEEHSKFWDTTDEEHKFIYTEIHGKYCKLMDSILEEPLKANNVTIEKFLDICATLREESDGNIQTFIDLLLTINDYSIFADLMKGKDKRDYYFYILKSWASHHNNNTAEKDDNGGSKRKK